jgi:hypothetical protein
MYENIGQLVDALLRQGWRNITFQVSAEGEPAIVVVKGRIRSWGRHELYYEQRKDGSLHVPVPF